MDKNLIIPKKRETSQAELADGYRQMASDREQEMEAEEWAEALIGDALDKDE